MRGPNALRFEIPRSHVTLPPMTALTAQSLPLPAEREAERQPPKPTWPLMGDVASFRAGVPEALIQWRRAQGEDDPAPQLSRFES